MKAKIVPKNILTKYLTGSLPIFSEVLAGAFIAAADGRASITASARSVMKEGVRPRAGTRAQFLMPDSRANSLYSMSISSRVSMCSLTKLRQKKRLLNLEKTTYFKPISYRSKRLMKVYLTGTAKRLFTPFWPSSTRTSSVYGFNHCTGPTRLWQSIQ